MSDAPLPLRYLSPRASRSPTLPMRSVLLCLSLFFHYPRWLHLQTGPTLASPSLPPSLSPSLPFFSADRCCDGAHSSYFCVAALVGHSNTTTPTLSHTHTHFDHVPPSSPPLPALSHRGGSCRPTKRKERRRVGVQKSHRLTCRPCFVNSSATTHLRVCVCVSVPDSHARVGKQ